MRRVFVLPFLLASFLTSIHIVVAEEDASAPLQAELGNIQVQYQTEKCGLRNVVIIANLQYTGAEKTARIEGFTPKINSNLFMYMSDYASKRAGKELRNKDIVRIINKTVDRVLGEDYIDEVLILSILKD